MSAPVPPPPADDPATGWQVCVVSTGAPVATFSHRDKAQADADRLNAVARKVWLDVRPVSTPPADDQAARARKVGQALAAAEFYDAVEDDVARVLANEVKRLQARTHEIQAQEMTKRAALDSELAEWRQRYEEAKRWTERNELRAEWASGQYAAHPFWSMTSWNARSALLRLVTQRDESVARLAAVRALADRSERETGSVFPGYVDTDDIRAVLDGAPTPEPDPQPVNTDLLDRMREGVTSREPAEASPPEPVDDALPQCPNDRPCPHDASAHDHSGYISARATCCVDGCVCGDQAVSVGPAEAAEPAPEPTPLTKLLRKVGAVGQDQHAYAGKVGPGPCAGCGHGAFWHATSCGMPGCTCDEFRPAAEAAAPTWLADEGEALFRAQVAEAAAPEPGPEHSGSVALRAFADDIEQRMPSLRDPDPLSDWGKGVAWAVDRARDLAGAGSVNTTTPPAPGYPRIADAINAACEAADIDLTVVHDGRVLDHVPGVVWLATVLDKAGLIDWESFADKAGSVTTTPAEPGADELLLVRLPGRMSGRPTVGHSRLPLTTLLEYLRAGDSPELVANAYPSVTAGEMRVVAALRDDLDDRGSVTTTPDPAAPLTFELYEHIVNLAYDAHREWYPIQKWRRGQAYANVLHTLAPRIQERMEKAGRDVFYRDDLIPAYLDEVRTALAGSAAPREEET